MRKNEKRKVLIRRKEKRKNRSTQKKTEQSEVKLL